MNCTAIPEIEKAGRKNFASSNPAIDFIEIGYEMQNFLRELHSNYCLKSR
jgi:hypothetical protein